MEAQVGRPDTLVKGAIWWEPIVDVMKLHSIDHATPQEAYDALSDKEKRWVKTWDMLLTEKRGDEHYADVVESIKRHGFIRPVTVQFDDYNTDLKYGDGHHRLAAAIDLGMSHILVQLVGNGWDDVVSEDSGSWDLTCEVPEENTMSMWATCDECGLEYSTDEEAASCCEYQEPETPEPEEDDEDESVDLHEHPSQRNYQNWCLPCGTALWDRERHNEAHREGRIQF